MNKREQLRQKLQRQQAILAAARTAGRAEDRRGLPDIHFKVRN